MCSSAYLDEDDCHVRDFWVGPNLPEPLFEAAYPAADRGPVNQPPKGVGSAGLDRDAVGTARTDP
jgi:hypothetical protein